MLKKLSNLVLGISLAFVSIMPMQFIALFATEKNEEQMLTIPVTQTQGETNYFTFAEGKWDAENEKVHRWSKEPNRDNPESTYYEVKFRGNKIDIYAGGNWPMGKVKYYIDGELKNTYNLYTSNNIPERKIATFEGLSEDKEHIFRAEATGEYGNNGPKKGNKIDAGKVVVYHNPYVVTDFSVSESMELNEGTTSNIAISNISPNYASVNDIKFESENEKIASVSESGVVVANGEGTTKITVSAKNGNVSKQITVNVKAGVPNLVASIVDTDTQYTQKRFEEVKKLGLTNKELTAWKNDKALSQLVIASDGTVLKDVTVEATDLVSDSSTISSKNIKATYVKSTKAYNGAFLGYGSKTRPVPAEANGNRSESSDILYESASSPKNIEANKVQPVWVEFNIPSNAKPGNYTTKLKINAKGLEKPLEFTYTIKVENALLPDATKFKENFDIELWQYPYTIAEYYGVTPFSEEHFKILKPHMELYKSLGGHAITTTIIEDAWDGQTYSNKGPNEVHYPSMIKWEKKNGKMTYDYTNFDKWVQFNKDLGIGDKIVLYSVAPWHNCFTYWEGNKLVKESYLNSNGTYKDNYKPMWSDFLNNLIVHLEKKGWFEESYIGIDERGFSKQAFDLIDSVTGSNAKPLKTAGAMDKYTDKPDLARRVTDLNVGDSAAAAHPEQFTKLLADREARGYRTTLYSCTEHVPGNFSLSAPAESYWSIINAGEETSGFLRWAYDAWVENPLEDATHNAFEPGDCFLVYPGDKVEGQIPQPRSSVRLEKMAEGVRDVNKLKLIAKEVPTLTSKVDAIYDAMTFNARSVSKGHYLNPEELKQVIGDTTSFKNSLETITDQYIDYKTNAAKEVNSVEITNKVINLELGSTNKLNVKVLPEKVIDNRVIWESNKPKIVSVDKNGQIKANRVGTAKITATSMQNEKVSDSITVDVIVPKIDEAAQHSYYSFDNENADDEWKAKRNGTVDLSKASFKQGKSGKALYVSKPSKDGAVKLLNSSNLPNKGDWTASYWVKADSFNGRSVPMADKSGNYGFALRLDQSTAMGLRVGEPESQKLTYKGFVFEANQWYNVALVQNHEVGTILYVNGKEIDKNAWSIGNNVFNAPLDVIGGDGFKGYIDEVKIYNRILTQSEINADMLTKGLNLVETEKTLFIGNTYEIDTNLISDEKDKTIEFESNDPKIASVDADGVVTAHKRGEVKIKVENKASGYVEYVTITVKKELTLQNTLTNYDLDEKYTKDIEKSPFNGEGPNHQYLGQPDMIRTRTGRLITAYPVGHGHGPLVMQISDDNGETWTEKKDIPSSWSGSQETPTLYTLNMKDGSERLMMITACPGWGTDNDGNKHGWNTSYSDDNGKTWSEYTHWYSTFNNGKENPVVVGMASLVQLKDEKGNFIQKWMGVYHEQTGFVNYKTYLTFDEEGNEQWSEPVPYLKEHREIEARNQMCEIGMFRSPDGKRIIGLARSQSHNNLSTLIYSDDEGETWSEPMEMEGSLAGERHKAAYDPISGRLLITFREIRYDLNGNNKFDGNPDWRAGNWVAWIGTYEDLMEQNKGEYRITLGKDYSQNAKGGDTGYAGVVVLEDGTFILDSYGHWDEEFSKSWKDHGSYNVKTDLCYIKQAKFKLSDIENENKLVNYDELNAYVQKVENTTADKYTEDSYATFTEALKNAQNIVANKESQQVEVNNALNALKEAFDSLQLKEEINPTPDPEVKPDPDGNKPVNPDGEKPAPEQPSVPTKPEKPENEAVENGETPSTSVSTNAALLWTMVLGAGFAIVVLANKKRKA